MSTDLRDLYQQVILDHQRSPRNFRAIDEASRQSHGENPLCGDKVTIYLDLEGDVAVDVSFQGVGCAICTSSASMMTEQVKGKSFDEIEALFHSFHEMLTAGGERADYVDSLGKLGVFSGVREFPIRVKCATLPWHTLRAAIDNRGETVSTEENGG